MCVNIFLVTDDARKAAFCYYICVNTYLLGVCKNSVVSFISSCALNALLFDFQISNDGVDDVNKEIHCRYAYQ